MTDFDCDVCVIGSGAGGGPIAFEASRRGRSVIVLEKGPWLRESDFVKDEISMCLRPTLRPTLRDEPQLVDVTHTDGSHASLLTRDTGWDFWNGALVGGATNLMSGFFHRMKPVDFKLRSTFGPVEDANVVDWPIDYDTLEPYYAKVEEEVGVSGAVVSHPFADRRSTESFPMPPTGEHPLAQTLDRTCAALGMHSFPTPRAILSRPRDGRESCSYSGYCGSYGCATGAKGSARAALLDRAIATGRAEIRARARVTALESDQRGRVVRARYIDAEGNTKFVSARTFVVACHAIESARLLLSSTGPRHPRGLANRSGLVGRNLLFSSAGWGVGDLVGEEHRSLRPFVNRSVQDFYVYEGDDGAQRKGGTLDFLLTHPNPIGAALSAARTQPRLQWGRPLQESLRNYFRTTHVMFEIFADWIPHEGSRVELSSDVRDRWNVPVARIRPDGHPRNREVVESLTARGLEVLRAIGATGLRSRGLGWPSTNLVAGTCRFGTDPATSVLDPDCRAHDADNLYVTDGSFMPTGGSVPYTFTIYANSFRVADQLLAAL